MVYLRDRINDFFRKKIIAFYEQERETTQSWFWKDVKKFK